MLKVPVRPPVPGHSEFLRAFTALFGGDGAEPVAEDLVGAIDAVCHDPVTAGEVECAARAMAAGKSTALGQVPVEYVATVVQLFGRCLPSCSIVLSPVATRQC